MNAQNWVLLAVIAHQIGQSHTYELKFEPDDFVEVRAEESSNLRFIIFGQEDFINSTIDFACSNNESCWVSDVTTSTINWSRESGYVRNMELTVQGKFIGLNHLVMIVNGKITPLPYEVRVLRSLHDSKVSNVFAAVATAVVIGITFMIGTQLEHRMMLSILKRPVGPMTGFFCQFFLMPILGFTLAYFVLEDESDAVRLALFAIACSPGGGKSSFWTIIFDGNLDMSVCITLIETLGAAVMTPIWLYTLGSLFFNRHIQMPFEKLAESLALVVVPTTLGMIAIRFRPDWIHSIKKAIKYVTWILVIVFMAIGLWANLFVFHFFTPRLVLCACLLPWSGYIIAFLVSQYVTRQTLRDSITIAIETGIQNIGVALTILLFAFPEPERDLGMVMIIAVVLVTDKPLLLIYLYLKFRGKSTKVAKNPRVPTVVLQVGEEDEKKAPKTRL